MSAQKPKIKFDSAEEQILYDIQAKLDIAEYVVKACFADTSGIQYNEFFKVALRYFPRDIVSDLVAKVYNTKNNPKTFLDWDKKMSMQYIGSIHDLTIDKLVRDIFVDHYVVRKSLPTKNSVIAKFNTKKPLKKKDIEMCLNLRGYKRKRLPGSTKTIIIEDPEQSFERMKYLHSIQQFRMASMHIVYIEEKIINKDGRCLDTLKRRKEDITVVHLAISSSMGILSKKFIDVKQNSMPFCNVMFPLITNWILETILPQLSVQSVIVVDEKLHNSKSYGDIPTMFSSKNDMKSWLENNNIPHNTNMHSAELFELIKTSSRNFPKTKYAIEEIFMAHGHKVLRRPHRAPYLNIIWEKVQNLFDKESVTFLSTMTINNWKCVEEKLVEIEQKTLNEDIEMSDVIDKIFTFMKAEKTPYEDIENCDDDLDDTKMEVVVQISES